MYSQAVFQRDITDYAYARLWVGFMLVLIEQKAKFEFEINIIVDCKAFV